MVAPNLPVAKAEEDYVITHRSRLARRTFYYSADDIRSLKRRIDALASAEAGDGAPKPRPPVSTFAALGWTAFARANGQATAPGDDTHPTFPFDLCARLRPPVGEDYFGNCGCLVSAGVGGARAPRLCGAPPAGGAGDPSSDEGGGGGGEGG
ncbi:hypothetical protein ACP70R_019748 [Stipagrostis hirtigluma subsp. patula]